MNLSDYYFKQNHKYSCSAQSVAVLYNYLNNTNITDTYLLTKYPRWNYYIHHGGIGIERLSVLVDDIFNTKSEIITNPDPIKLLHNIKNYNVIIYYNKNGKHRKKGHYTPILDYKKSNGSYKIKIGLSGSHNMKWVTIDYILSRLKSYIIF